ncbi:MAG: hypothetical protein JXK93_01415 [Sphaerochaetaceae bacterium]|nr:hypothetical protein [Sphaerochaetaceae bacterium]
MALKKKEGPTDISFDTVKKAENVFQGAKTSQKEKKILTTFSIEPSFKKELEGMFQDMGLGWAAGIRFALREFLKKYSS